MTDNFSATATDAGVTGVKIVHLKGQLDELGIEVARATVDPLLTDETIQKIIFDFTQVIFINSKGIGYLVSVHTHLSKNSRALMIVSANQPVMDVISLVGLTSIIPYFPTVEEALKNL